MSAPHREYPRPFDARMLNAGDGHWIYVEECGRKGGRPCVFLHGGPGSGSQPMHRTLFDPECDHAFLIDQRGAGRSHPHLLCKANTTADLIADLELVREHFGIGQWLVTGGSWGSTLALAYAQAHPGRVTGLVLRALFLGTRDEVQWAFIDGPQVFRPELFKAFRDWLPVEDRHDPLAAYIQRLLDPAPDVHRPAAFVWNAYERILSEVVPSTAELPLTFAADARTPPTPILEAHYIANDFFLKPGHVMANAARLSGIPGVIVQGRYDLLCPPHTAVNLVRRWPKARLDIVEGAGHAITEAGVMEKLRTAIAAMPG